MIPAKFGAYMEKRLEVIQFLVNFSFLLAAIFDFEKWRFRPIRCLGGVKAKLHTKFGENQSNGSDVIQLFVNFKIAAPPSWIPLFSNFWPIFSFSVTNSI